VSELSVNTIGSVGKGTDHPEPHESNDCSVTIAEGCKLEKSGTVAAEGWVKELARVSSTHLPPGHPCLVYLKGRGFDLGTDDDLNRFTGNSSPLGGKRWYIAVSVKGKVAEFLVDTGASHSIISRRFCDLVSDKQSKLDPSANALTADGSRLQTFGKRFMKINMGGKEFAFSPTIADISDDGILGLDFASLYGAVLNPRSGVLKIEHPYDLKVKGVLRQISCVASVAQTMKIPPGHTCDILYRGDPRLRGHSAVVEPNTVILASLGLECADTLVANASWATIPISNQTDTTVYLQKGTKVGEVILAEAVTSSLLDLPIVVTENVELNVELNKLLKESDIKKEVEMNKLISLIKRCSGGFLSSW